MRDEKGGLDELCINTLRMLSVDAVNQANSGHPGLPMGAAAMAYTLFTKFLKHDPKNPDWPDRDRFVLSGGHGSALLYSLLHLTGYELSLEEIKNFRQWESKTPGHPEYGLTPGVSCTTGPLGQGLANAVGMAMAEAFLAATFNKDGHTIVDHCTYVMLGDGDMMEGISHEAASYAGHLKLGKLICLYDDNNITIDGKADLSFSDDTAKRFEAYGWHVQRVEDGNDTQQVADAIEAARAESGKPSLLLVKTHIGFGSPNRQDTSKAHGEPLGDEETALTKKNLGWTATDTFHIPDEVLSTFRAAIDQGGLASAKWDLAMKSYDKTNPEDGKKFRQWMEGTLPSGWDAELPVFEPDAKGTATRGVSGKALNSIAPFLENMIGGSADLTPSNKTLISDSADFLPGSYEGRNLRFGVREHAMGAVANGLAYHGGILPYCATFFVFTDYMRPAMRLAALGGLKVIYVMTHDSIGVGEDGPTHQPVEHLSSLRAMPGLRVIRPSDANETAQAWKTAVTLDGPTVLVLTRQGVPIAERTDANAASLLSKGAYILRKEEGDTPDVILMASGSEVSLAMNAAEELAGKGVQARVVSMPCWELFEAQDESYKEQILPPNVSARVAVEAGCSLGWERYTGLRGRIVAIDHFGASAPAKVLFEKFGITTDNVVQQALALVKS